MKSDSQAPLPARLQEDTTETQVASPPHGDGRLSGEGERPLLGDGRLSGEGKIGGGDGLAPPPPELSRRRRRARIAAAGAIVLVGVAVALAVLLRSQRKPPAGTGSGVPAGETTVSVRRRTLTERAQVDGTLGYGGTLELYDRIAGTFTWLPSVGSVIRRGGTLFEVNQLPVVLMYGSVPAYRALKEGVGDGEDVAQLNENLVALGYDPDGAIADDERFGEATAAAVRRWQQAEGLPQTGQVELGRVIFAPSARRVTAVKPTLGQDPPGEGPEAPREEAPEKGASQKKPPRKNPQKKEAPKEAAPAKETAAKETAAKDPGNGGGPSKGTPSEGESPGADAGTPVLTTTSTQQIVQLQVEADQQQLARVGESAPVTLPGGRTVKARITSVGTVATESGGENGEGGKGGESGKATISVTLALDRRVPRLDAAPVAVELVKEKRRDVLTVPATALIATAGGGYAVEALQGKRRVEVAVTPGMFADGYVQIEGEGVREGLTVTEPAE